MQSLEPHLDHRIARLRAEAENRRLIELVPAPDTGSRWVAPRNRRLIAIVAAIAATILTVGMAAFDSDARSTTPATSSMEPGPLSSEPGLTQPVATEPPLYPGGARVLVRR